MNTIANASEPWTGHSFQEVESYLKKQIGLYGAELIDMGLPSGTKWADRNIGAESETEPGLYFQWGDTEGFSKDSGRYCSGSRNNERDWTGDYARCHGSELGDSQNIPVDPYFDAARKNMGAPWRMPTQTEFEELINNCDFVDASGNVVTAATSVAGTANDKRIRLNGVVGIRLKSKTNGNMLFFPAAGYFDEGFDDYGADGHYWSSSYDDSESAYYLGFSDGNVYSDGSNGRYYGYSVRGVQ